MDEPNTDFIQGTLDTIETADWNRRASAIARLLKGEG
jgi:hypothetical protein